VFPGNKFRILLNLARRGHVHVADAWETFLREQLSDACFEDSSVPLAIVAVRLKDGQRVVFDSGEIVPAIMASTAIPGVFPPHRVGDELFVDGGVVEYLPLATVLERGATTVYAMDCSWFSYNSAYRGSVVDRCSRISASNYVERATALSATRGVDVHLLRPELRDFDDSRDFRHTASLVATGYDYAMQYLNEETDAAASGI